MGVTRKDKASNGKAATLAPRRRPSDMPGLVEWPLGLHLERIRGKASASGTVCMQAIQGQMTKTSCGCGNAACIPTTNEIVGTLLDSMTGQSFERKLARSPVQYTI